MSNGTLRHLSIYGLEIGIGGTWQEVTEAACMDFAWFEKPSREVADIVVNIERRPPDFSSFDDVSASSITPRSVTYQSDGRSIADYFGRVISVWDPRERTVLVEGEDQHIAHEAVYALLRQHVANHLDALGFVRLHALGLSSTAGAVAILLPSGGGKSTLALRALRHEGIRLLSEDAPLLDRHGSLHPFPLRIGVNATDAAALPGNHRREIDRLGFRPKLALEIDDFRDRIEPFPQPLRHMVLGNRSLGMQSRLEPLHLRQAVPTLIKVAVLRVGTGQGVQYVMQRRGLGRTLRGFKRIGRRALSCAAGARQAKLWRLTLSRDPEANWEQLLKLFQ